MKLLPNRYRDLDEDDESYFDDVMEMSDEELAREEETQIRQLNEAFAALTPIQRYRISRRNKLRLCITHRNAIRQNMAPDLMRGFLRDTQIAMVKLRIERATGIRPGVA